jgi:diguanylate cyclase (GGDEF)-like protein/PAS domain S-box-containing protein
MDADRGTMAIHSDSQPDGLGRPSDTWLARALDRSSDLAAVIGPDTVVQWVSRSSRALIGHAPEAIEGRSIAEFVHPDDLERAAEVADLASSGPFGDQLAITPARYRIRHADGRWVSLEVNATPGSADGRLLLMLRRNDDPVLLDELVEMMTTGAPFEDQLDVVVRIGGWRHPEEGYAVLFDEVDGIRRTRSSGLLDRRLVGVALDAGATPWARAMELDERVVVDDLEDRECVSAELAAVAAELGFDAVVAVPVRGSHGEAACIVVWSTPQGPTSVGQRYATDNMARALSLILQWRANHGQLERAAHVDSLTGVASRGRFFDLAHQAIDKGASAALFLDLDGFKEVNDGHGHGVGDRVLAEIGARLAAVVEDEVLLGRVGGDEFAAICPRTMPAEEVERLAERLTGAVRPPIPSDAGEIALGSSMGVAVRREGEALASLLGRADRALLAVKASGKDGWRLAE